jgi:hypothetical protein
MDAETSEMVAGIVGLLRRAAELASVAIDSDSAASSNQVLDLGVDLAANEARNLLADAILIDGPASVAAELANCADVALEQMPQPNRESGTGVAALLTRASPGYHQRSQHQLAPSDILQWGPLMSATRPNPVPAKPARRLLGDQAPTELLVDKIVIVPHAHKIIDGRRHHTTAIPYQDPKQGLSG